MTEAQHDLSTEGWALIGWRSVRRARRRSASAPPGERIAARPVLRSLGLERLGGASSPPADAPRAGRRYSVHSTTKRQDASSDGLTVTRTSPAAAIRPPALITPA